MVPISKKKWGQKLQEQSKEFNMMCGFTQTDNPYCQKDDIWMLEIIHQWAKIFYLNWKIVIIERWFPEYLQVEQAANTCWLGESIIVLNLKETD